MTLWGSFLAKGTILDQWNRPFLPYGGRDETLGWWRHRMVAGIRWWL